MEPVYKVVIEANGILYFHNTGDKEIIVNAAFEMFGKTCTLDNVHIPAGERHGTRLMSAERLAKKSRNKQTINMKVQLSVVTV